MTAISQGEKTEKATPKKRQDERKKGNIFQSRDITSAIGILVLFVLLQALAQYFYGSVTNLFPRYLTDFASVSSLSTQGARNYLSDFVLKTFMLSLPFLFITAVTAIVIDSAQTRMNFAISRLKPDFTRLDPIKGFKKLFSIRSVVELIKSMIKVAIVGAILYTEIKNNLPGFACLLDKSILHSLCYVCDMAVKIVIKAGLFLLLFGLLDYFYQWWEYERQMRMSRQDIKDEYKQTEGDPQIRGRLREKQRRLSMQRIAQKVPLADVVIKNPTHFAIAVKYDKEKDKAPRVIAKGQDYLALKIIEIAEAHDICVVANPPLARGLYEAVKLEQEIPEKFYQAVAEILVFVYTRLNKTNH
ncbi:MAG: flagellar biosynthesis protein FlhB [Clostridia bacterium]|nr:flagellar biosynthesis protein FlhB [Clostridia bacterium]